MNLFVVIKMHSWCWSSEVAKNCQKQFSETHLNDLNWYMKYVNIYVLFVDLSLG